MKNGEKILCPHCGEKSFLKEKKCFDDSFALKEVKFFCALCGGEIRNTSEKSPAPSKAAAAAERLSALLGGEKVARVTFAPEADDGHFCLHCRNFIKHPFMNRCGLTLKEVEATDSCDSFEKSEE